MREISSNPAQRAAEETRISIRSCIDAGKNFLVEAGAGAGKTYSLVEALKYIIANRGRNLIRMHQQVACITYTNVAVQEIEARIDRHPAVAPSTIHAFCWSLIRGFQPYLRRELPTLGGWPEKISEFGELESQAVTYDELGHRLIDQTHAALHHNDVLALAVKLLAEPKFRMILTSRHPIIFIDEYQDTDTAIAAALQTRFLDTRTGPLIGFFGDHWQKIYGTGCGKIHHHNLEIIGKRANFRSAPAIVECLNRMRPELPQEVQDPTDEGNVSVYHTNDVRAQRRTGQHWSGDLPPEIAGAHVDALVRALMSQGWDFAATKTKILMLTHKVLAAKQGYANLADVFDYADDLIKRADPYIAFFHDELEPMCVAYAERRYGDMFAAMGQRTPAILSPADKVGWAKDMDILLRLREESTIGAVLDHIKQTRRPRITDAMERRERSFEQYRPQDDGVEPASVARTRQLRTVLYKEVTNASLFIDEKTPFSTKHGVKGAEFENVLVVFGRGWNLYNFAQFLEWGKTPPADKRDTWERNRNLFYVTCSRPRKRLALLFTQQLSQRAIDTLGTWFGAASIHSFSMNG